MTTLVLTPALPGQVIELGNRTWRHKLLPVGDVDYKGRILHFTPAYLKDLARAFSDGAYPQVPFQLADAENAHTNDPERFRGEVISMDAEPDGLWVTARLTEAGERVVSENPNLGISARIVEDFSRSDGKFYPQAVQHVLGTLDPRIPSLGGWQQVDMAGGPSDYRVIDLSAATWIGLDATRAEVAAADQALAEAAAEGDPYADLTLEDLGLTEEDLAAIEAEQATPPPQEQEFAMTVTPEEQEFAIQLAQVWADQGDLELAADLLAEAGVGAIELSNGGFATAFELAEQGRARQETRQAEDAMPMPRTSEDRLAALLGRVSRGTYAPDSQHRAMGLASPSSAASQLARHRWSQNSPDAWNSVMGTAPCGSIDALGQCAERFHAAGCGSYAGPDMAQKLIEDGIYSRQSRQPVADSNGRVWADHSGVKMTMADHIEAATGQRLGDHDPYAAGEQRRLVGAPRQLMVGDVDDGTDPGENLHPAPGLAATMGLAPPPSAHDRGRAQLVARRESLQRGHQVARELLPGHSRFDMASRREAQQRRPNAEPIQVDQPLHGSLPVYTRGSL
jgi:hypothetical protein